MWKTNIRMLSIAKFYRIFSINQNFLEDEMQIWTIEELATFLQISEKTIYRLAGEGKVPGFKVGGAWRFKREEIYSWIDARHHNKKDAA